MNNIPTIDISPLLIPSDEQTKYDVSKTIRNACETVGCFLLIGHGIDRDLIDATITEAQRFFNQSSEEKERYLVHKWNPLNANTYRGYFPASSNGKEGLDLCSPHMNREHESVKRHHPLHELNQWPTDGILSRYWDEIWRVVLTIMRAVALTFNLNESYFDELLDAQSLGDAGNLSTLRFNFYPLLANPMTDLKGTDDGEYLSCEEHYDKAILTLLYQHRIGGLQIKAEDGTWIDVPVVPYSFVLNTGKCLEQWTNGRLKAAFHRVKFLKEERISIPFFLEGCYSTPIVPLLTGDDKPEYEPINYGPYILERNKLVKEYQRDG